tara:strand:+ start:746 stop:1045 length:300 start_codon:yes stop_codon:yes gene_type:complete
MKQILLSIFIFTFLSGCFQNTAMIGPGFTFVSTGNLPQAFGTYVTNKAVEEETGMQAHQFIAKKVEEQKVKNKRKNVTEDLINLLENNIKKTRSIINSN